jgi:hypothetical protein
VPVPTGIKSLIPGAKKGYKTAVMAAWKNYEADLEAWRIKEAQRTRELGALEVQYTKAVRAFEAKNKCMRKLTPSKRHIEQERQMPSSLIAQWC